MRVRGLIDEDFVNYKVPSMFIGTAMCDWKCCIEQNLDRSICQNSSLYNSKIVDVPVRSLYLRYINNPISKAIVIGGLEPILQFNELIELVYRFRYEGCADDFVIYTGYYPNEIKQEIIKLQKSNGVIMKFGRYIPGHDKHFDDVLGVYLASDNQYAMRIC